MTRWVALLRGVNVNGTTVRSAELKQLFADLGSSRTATVLASGNVVFEAPDDEGLADVKARVEVGLRERFGYDAWVVLVSPSHLQEVVKAFPFARADPKLHPYVVFTADVDVLASVAQRAHETASHDVEAVQLAGDVLYWQVPKGSSTDTPIAKILATSTYKPHLTTRTLRTLEKVLAASA